MDDDFISASEISEYLFCQRAWWYRLHGVTGTRTALMAEGTEAHEELAQELRKVETVSRLAWRLFLFGTGLLLAFLILKLIAGF